MILKQLFNIIKYHYNKINPIIINEQIKQVNITVKRPSVEVLKYILETNPRISQKYKLNEVLEYNTYEYTNMSKGLLSLINYHMSKIPKEKLNIPCEIKELYTLFTSLDIEEDFYKIKKIYYFSSQIGTNIFNIIYYGRPKNIKRIYKKIFTIAKIVNVNNVTMTIRLFPSSKKKYLSEHKMLGPKQVNSAVSIHEIGETYGNIVIWREEELEKVLCHELMHSLNLDMKPPYPKTELGNVEGNKNINEAYAESWAIILNSIFVSNEYNEFIEIIIREQLFSILQVSKLMNFYNYNNFSEFLYNVNDKKLYQTTSVFSYYIIRSALLFNIYGFMLFCLFSNKNLIKFNNKYKKKYLELVNKSLESVYFHREVNKYINTEHNHSLRMTLFG